MKSKDINFEYIEEFVDYVINEVENDEELFIAIVGKFNEIKAVLKHIMFYEDVNFESLHLESPEMSGYGYEFVLSIWVNDGVLEIGCAPLKVDGKYTNPCGDETFLFEDCSSKIIPLCEGSDLYFVNFDEECDCDEECVEEYCFDCNFNDKEVANTDKFSYYINHEPVTKDEFDKKYKELHEKYEKNCKDLLLKHCEFMDDFNNVFGRLL